MKKILLIGKEKIELTRDEYGVIHVLAQNDYDIYKGLGYAHALDRGMQLLLMRVLGKGQLSEHLDSSDESLEIDRFFRRMNFFGNTKDEVKKLDKESLEKCNLYCDGINDIIKKKYPWEFKLLGYKPDKWTIEDCILISRMIGYLTLAQSQFEIERLLVQLVQNGVTKNFLNELFPDILTGLDIELINKVKLVEKIVPTSIKWNNSVPRFMASNNWVISGKKTKSKKPILANDPHLETNRLPNVWYEIVLKENDNFAIASTMPGLAGILLARTKHLAWGATYTFMDSIDSWIEECKDGKYRREDKWHDFNIRKEFIKRKKKPAFETIFYENDLGCLEGNPNEDGFYMNTKWFPVSSGGKSLINMLKMWKTKTVEDGMKHLGNLETSWNWVLADSAGNIGYQMSGLMPKRKKEASGFVPLPAWKKENIWTDFYSYKDLPRCINPKEEFFVTANNNLNKYGKEKPINICMADYREKRISQLLKNSEKITVEEVFNIHYDVYSLQAEAFMKIIKPLLPETKNGEILKKWDFCYDPESEGAYLFELIYKGLIVEVFGTIIGKEVLTNLLGDSGIFIDFYSNFDTILLAEKSLWFNNRNRDDIYKQVIETVLKAEARKWKENQKIMLTNILFSGKLPSFLGFDKGPIVVRGGRATVQQGQIYKSAGRTTSFIPSYRIVTDFSEEIAHTNMAGGPSDRRFSPWYNSDTQRWLNKEYKRMKP